MPNRPDMPLVVTTGELDAADRLRLGISDAEGSVVRIEDPATLKVFADPVRRRLVTAMVRPMSVKELAAATDETLNRVYYHLRLLERHGLIRVADTRQVHANLERLYERAGTWYRIDAALWVEEAAAIDTEAPLPADDLHAVYGRALRAATVRTARRMQAGEPNDPADPNPLILNLIGFLRATDVQEIGTELQESIRRRMRDTAETGCVHTALLFTAVPYADVEPRAARR